MIAKVITSSSVSNLISYLTEKNHEVFDMNNVFFQKNIASLVKEFKATQHLNTTCKKPNFHIILSFSKKEIIPNEKMEHLLHDFIREFVGKEAMWVAIKHPDTDRHQHLHLVVNRVLSTGKVLSSKHTAYRALNICRKLEIKYKLNKLSSFKQINHNFRKEQLKKLIDRLVIETQTIEAFKSEIEKHRFKVLIARGITFIDKNSGVKLKGSSIGREYSLSALQRRIINQDKNLNYDKTYNTDLQVGHNSDSSQLVSLVGDSLSELLKSKKSEYSYDEEIDKKRKRKKRRFRRM